MSAPIIPGFRDAGATAPSLAPEAETLANRTVVGVELRLDSPRAPAEERAHPLGDGWRAVEAETRPGPEPGPAKEHVLERHRELALHGPVELGEDLRRVLAE